MARINKEQAVTNALREEGLKIVGSDKSTSTEKMHWSKLLFDMQDVTKQELTVQLKQAEDTRAAAEESLATVAAERDALLAEVSGLREQAAKVVPLESELAELKSAFDARVSEARKELLTESQQHQWKAEAAERRAKEIEETTRSKFDQQGFQLLLDYVKTIVERNRIVEPDPATLPNGISPFLLVCWGHSVIKAQFMIAYAKSFTSPTEAFKQELMRVLRAGLPTYPSVWGETRQPDPLPNLGERLAVLTSMAVKWNVLTEIQRRIEAEQVQRQANFLRENNANLAAQVSEAVRRGDTREEIAVEEPSLTGYTGEHPPECVCGRPGCNPLPAHLRPYEIPETL